jgi:hypothetical protein
MNIQDIPDHDLGALLEFCRYSASNGNRVFLDLFYIIEKESLRRHRSTEIQNYQGAHLIDAVERLASLVDSQREAGVPNDYPALLFIRETLSAIITEGERRQRGDGETVH